MVIIDELIGVAKPLGDSIRIKEGPFVSIRDPKQVRNKIEAIVRTATLGQGREKSLAQWLIRSLAIELGAIPSSIHDFYLARGAGKTPDDFTVPAMNLRALPYHAARAVFRAAGEGDASAFIFEIARSEMGYTDQRPSEYSSAILAAAIAEGYEGPVFIQGDHFQVSASRYADNAQAEITTVQDLIEESIAAGFYNIDIDTSTLVDLSKSSISAQQEINYTLSAELSAFVRKVEPQGITVSLGGEIGEVGGQNSTEPELRAYMDGFVDTLSKLSPDSPSLSKISIQTGTSHGGVVLPDGSIAEVSVDFETLAHLSRVAKEYGMGGAVQHGASTLPDEAFTKFAESNALEVHLATGFQNILYDLLPEELRDEIYAYLEKHHDDERKEGQTADQFYYKTRKRGIGPYKKQLWDMPEEALKSIEQAWENQFRALFERLNVFNTRAMVEDNHTPIPLAPDLETYLEETGGEEDVSDLAD
jgi:fructose/tagatose bisphosphate aldolase